MSQRSLWIRLTMTIPEDKLFERAIDRKLIDRAEVDAAARHRPPSASGRAFDWSPRISEVLENSRLSESALLDLISRLAADHALHETVHGSELRRAIEELESRQNDDSSADTTAGRPRSAALVNIAGLEKTRYRFEGVLGRGAVGQVFKAFDPRLERYVAIKALTSTEPGFSHRFQREAKSQARIDHPNVAKVFEVGVRDGVAFIAMQYVAGGTLRDIKDQLSLEQKVKLIAEVCDGLHAAHRLGVVHRDVKPNNILIERGDDDEPRALIADFGLARSSEDPGVTRTGVSIGTPAYMAPEQAKGDNNLVDRRTDVYGLGATLYELLSGSQVFGGSNSIAVIRSLIDEDPTPLRQRLSSLPSDLETITMKCLEKDPQRRYPSARQLSADLRRFLDGEPVLATPPTWSYRLGKKLRKHRSLVAVASIALLATTIVTGIAFDQRRQARAQAEAARKFGAEVESIEWLQLASYQLPLHDVRPQRELLHQRLDSIELAMSELGQLARGPGNYALGRGYLLLQEPIRAREHLQAAWDGGYRPPEVASALGQSLGESYTRSLAQLDLIENTGARDRRRDQLVSELREPALEYLRYSRDNGLLDDRGLVEARIALFEGRNAEARELALAAVDHLPWLYSAFLLAADADQFDGAAASSQGKYEDAAAAYDRAADQLRSAQAIASSDPQVYLRQCQVANAKSALSVWKTARDPSVSSNVARRACSASLEADPDLGEAFIELALDGHYRAEAALSKGQDPSEALAEAREAALEATRLAPRDATSHLTVARVASSRLIQASQSGQDIRPVAEEAIQALERSIELDPRNPTTYHMLGITWNDLGTHEAAQGLDPTTSLERSLEFYEKVIEIDPEASDSLIAISGPYYQLASWTQRTGGDPVQYWEAASAALRRAIELEPDRGFAYVNLGAMLYMQGKHELAHGRDSLAAIEEAIAAFQTALESIPEDAFTHYNLGHAYRILALRANRLGQDPSPWIDRGIAAFTTGLEINPGPAGPYATRAELHLLSASRARKDGRDPVPGYDRAAADIVASLARDPKHRAGLAARGHLGAERGRFESQHSGDDRGWFRRAAEAYRQLLSIDADNPEALLGQGQLIEQQILASPALAPKRLLDLVDQGLEAVNRALEINPQYAAAHFQRGKILRLAAIGTTESSLARDFEHRFAAAFERAIEIDQGLERAVSELE